MASHKHSLLLRITDMQWLLLVVGLIPSSVSGQRWTDSVILTQHGPVSYKPVHHPRYGYYTADVLPVYSGQGTIEGWPPYGTAFDVPLTTGVNVGHPPLMTQLKSSIPMKRKKSTMKKNPYYHKITQYDKSNTKLTTSRPKQTFDSTYDQRINNIRNSMQSGYTYRGRRFQTRGIKVRQSDKILKGQVIDHNKIEKFQQPRPQARSTKNEIEKQDINHNQVSQQYFNNGHQGPNLGLFHYPQSDTDTTDDAYFN